jgi:foldase protein PrsA
MSRKFKADCMLLLAAGGLVWVGGLFGQTQQQPAPVTPSGLPNYDKNIVAYVNGQPITRQDLAEELIARKGKLQIQAMINRKIIEQAAKSAGVAVTDAEIDGEVTKLAKFARCDSIKEYEEKVLKFKHNTTLLEYREDVIKHGLYLRKLAGQRLTVTDQDVRQLFDAKYGEKVKCRIIILMDEKTALATHAKIREEAAGAKESSDPKENLYRAFLRYARQQADPTLAATAGDIQPIGHLTLVNDVEKTAFSLRDGELSEVIEMPDGGSKAYGILLREKLVPPDTTVAYETVRDELREEMLDRKMRTEVPKMFKEFREHAVVRDYLNNTMDIKEVLQQAIEEQDRRKTAPTGPASAQKK